MKHRSFLGLSRSVVLGLAATAGLAGWAIARLAEQEQAVVPDLPPQPPARGGNAALQPTPLPHGFHDNFNVNWEIQPDGSVSGNELFDAGGQLFIGEQEYNSPNQQAALDGKTGELVLPPVQVNGFLVSRRIGVNAKEGWCRWAETIENPTNSAVHVQLRIHFDYNGLITQSKEIADERKKQIAFVMFDGNNHGIAAVGAGRGAKVTPLYQPQMNSDQMWVTYEIDIPAKKSASIVHLQISRPNLAEAARSVETTKDKDFLAGLPKEVLKTLVNFRVADHSVGDVEVLRGGLLDVVELRGGDQYRGTLQDKSFELETPFGPVELPAAGVVGMITAGTFRPMQLFVTTDGQVMGGRLKGDTIHLQLSSGQVTNVPVANITRLGYRAKAGETEDWKFDKPFVFLRDGQRVSVAAPAEAVPVSTVYGPLTLRPEVIGAISFQGDDQPVHQVRLVDGSKFAGLVNQESFELHPRAIGGGKPVAFTAASMTKLQLSRNGEDVDDEAPTMTLSNGDVLVGTLSGTIELETTFDTLRVNGAEMRGVRHVPTPEAGLGSQAEVQMTLWDGATLSGRLKTDTIPFLLGCGVPVRIPAGLLTEFAQPNPQPPQQMVDQIKTIVAELNNKDWKARDRAADQLLRQGPGVAAVLRTLRQGQPGQAQTAIDGILKKLDEAKKAAKAPPPPPILNKDGPEPPPPPDGAMPVAPNPPALRAPGDGL